MKTIVLQFLALIVWCGALHAQGHKKTVGMVPFTYGDAVEQEHLDILQSKIESFFINHPRIQMISSAEMSDLLPAGDLDPTSLPEGLPKGMQYLVFCQVENLSFEEKTNKETGEFTGYAASLRYTLRVVDTGSKAIVTQRSFAPVSLLSRKTKGKALASLFQLSMSKKRISNFIKEAFPMDDIVIEEVLSADKKRALNVLIAVGESSGVRKGDRFMVCELIPTPSGGTRQKTVGELKIIDVQGADYSECKVLSGGEAILHKLKFDQEEGGSRFVCKTMR